MNQPRNHPAPNTLSDRVLQVCGLRWHGSISVVGAPRGSYRWRFVTPPRTWSRGIRNAARSPFRSPFGGG